MADIGDYFHTDKKTGRSWIRVVVDEAAEARAKAFQAQRDKLGVTCDISERRWCGPLAEEVFHLWLEGQGIEHDWDHDPDHFDSWDIYQPPRYIDVKCCAAASEPLLHYGCNVKKTQVKNPNVTDYVFARYLWPEKEMIIMGGISKLGFMDEPLDRKEGDVVNQMTVKEPFWEQPIENLTDLEEFLAGPACVDCNHWNGYMEGQLCGRCYLARRQTLQAVL